MSVVTEYITRPLSNKEVHDLANIINDKKMVLQELRELQKLMKDDKHPNKSSLLIQFNNLLKVVKYMQTQKHAVEDVYENLTKTSSKMGPAKNILKFLGHGRKSRKQTRRVHKRKNM